jgi:hemerythrin-like metal-binding protein
MAKMEWTTDLSVGVDLIDEQHKNWIQRFNDVSAAIEAMQGPARVAEALDFLSTYTLFHFATEEKYMDRSAYPDADAHKAKHAELRKTLADLNEEFEEEGATHILAESINSFVGNWLVNHIQEVDTKFGAFLREKGVVVNETA